jgi:hypothetical protein
VEGWHQGQRMLRSVPEQVARSSARFCSCGCLVGRACTHQDGARHWAPNHHHQHEPSVVALQRVVSCAPLSSGAPEAGNEAAIVTQHTYRMILSAFKEASQGTPQGRVKTGCWAGVQPQGRVTDLFCCCRFVQAWRWRCLVFQAQSSSTQS